MGPPQVRKVDYDDKKVLTSSRMIITGLSGIVLIEIYAAVMQRQFQNTSNRLGKGFAILGIYLFVVTYCEQPCDMSFLSITTTHTAPQTAC